MTNQLRLMFDIDDTITLWDDNREYTKFKPIKAMVSKINLLYDQGHHITLFTARGMTSVGPDKISTEIVPELLDNLKSIGLKFHELITHKPSYDLLVDDKAIDPNTFLKLSTTVQGADVPIETVLKIIELNNKVYQNERTD